MNKQIENISGRYFYGEVILALHPDSIEYYQNELHKVLVPKTEDEKFHAEFYRRRFSLGDITHISACTVNLPQLDYDDKGDLYAYLGIHKLKMKVIATRRWLTDKGEYLCA